MRKNILAVSAVCFHLSQINVFLFRFFLFASSVPCGNSVLPERCVSVSVVFFCLLLVHIREFHCVINIFLFYLVYSKIFYVECETLSNKLIYSGKSMFFLLFFYIFYSFLC